MSLSAKKSIAFIIFASFLSLSLLFSLFVMGARSLRANAPLHVDDDNCPNVGTGTVGDPFCTIQSAVDIAADFGEIWVATGTYTGTHQVTAKNGLVYTQVVIIDRKSITITGGFDGNDWLADPDPVANPAVIDAERSGRGVTILGLGNQAVTLDGLIVTGGDYTGSGNPDGLGNQVCLGTGYDCGGGIRAYRVRLVLRNLVVFDNIAGRTDQSRPTQGGGMDAYQLEPGSLIESSTFISNTAGGDRGYGGGINFAYSEVIIKDSLFEDNYAARSGGGLTILLSSPIIMTGTSFKDNRAASNGGAVYAEHGFCELKEKSLEMDGGYLTGNQAFAGSAILINHSTSWAGDCGAKLTNLILAKNATVGTSASQAVINLGNYSKVYPLELNHLTAAENDSFAFLYMVSDSNSQAITATVDNTLVVSSSVGIVARENAGEMKISVNHPLFSDVTEAYQTQSGTPLFVVSNEVLGDPRLDGTYHLGWGSAAINTGFNAGVRYDIDGDPRLTAFPDIGADELNNLHYTPLITR